MYVFHPRWGFDTEMPQEIEAMDSLAIMHGHLLDNIPAGSVVLPRFRALPFGRELEEEVNARGSVLLNSFSQHRWCADLGAWYRDLAGMTPFSWNSVEQIPSYYDGPFFVKGETNSRRQQWGTHAYAENRAALGRVIANLLSDSLIQHQTIWIRQFVPLRSFGTDVVGMPISNEYRVFFLDGKPVAKGFYWANHANSIHPGSIDPERIPFEFINAIGMRVADRVRFAAVDVAETEGGEWIVVEVNDGQMAGLCGCEATEVYTALRVINS